MRVIDIAGRLQTAGTWAETAESEADAQALLRHTREGLRRMLDGNEQFHVDPMAAPAVLWVGVDMAKPGSDQTAVTLIAPSAPAAPDVWHTEAPTVAGVYETRPADSRNAIPRSRWWDGNAWHQNHERENATMDQVRTTPVRELGPLVWLRLISADTPPIADWRPGDQVPEGERTGLWHYDNKAHSGPPDPAQELAAHLWDLPGVYRPAAPGVREGEAYDEARYGVAG